MLVDPGVYPNRSILRYQLAMYAMYGCDRPVSFIFIETSDAPV